MDNGRRVERLLSRQWLGMRPGGAIGMRPRLSTRLQRIGECGRLRTLSHSQSSLTDILWARYVAFTASRSSSG